MDKRVELSDFAPLLAAAFGVPESPGEEKETASMVFWLASLDDPLSTFGTILVEISIGSKMDGRVDIGTGLLSCPDLHVTVPPFWLPMSYFQDHLGLAAEYGQHPSRLDGIEKVVGRCLARLVERLSPPQRKLLADWQVIAIRNATEEDVREEILDMMRATEEWIQSVRARLGDPQN